MRISLQYTGVQGTCPLSGPSANSDPTKHVAALDQEGDRLIHMSWAPRTLQVFEVGMTQFRLFRAEMSNDNLDAPSNPTEIIRFISSLSLKKKATATINAYISAVSNWHKCLSYEDPCSNFLVKQALKGTAKALTAPDIREPITIDLLHKLSCALHSVCYSIHEAKMYKSLFCLAFFGLFRIGELICTNKKTAQKGVLQINDIAFRDNSMKIMIRFSKTDQLGKSTTMIIEGNPSSTLCPVQAAKEFIESRGQYAGPLFCHFNRLFLSRFQFNKVLSSALKFIQSEKHIRSHSFRIGGATHAICKGMT
jgi:hypothetical protein